MSDCALRLVMKAERVRRFNPMYMPTHGCWDPCAHTHLIQSGVPKWIMIGVLTQCVLFPRHAGLTMAREAQPQTLRPVCCVYNLDFTPSPASFRLRCGISHNLFRQEGSHEEYKRWGAPVRKQDTTRQGQRK